MNDKQTPDFSKSNSSSEEIDVAKLHASILRERMDPKNGVEPIPIWLMIFIMGLVLWAGLFLGFNSGGFQSDVYNASLVNWAGGGAAESAGPDPMVAGKKVYMQNCMVCHQGNGEGAAGQFPPLVGSEWVLAEGWHGDNHLANVILLGLQGPVEVKGAAYNGAMPGWQQLTDDQIASVITYIRNEWGNSGSPMTADHVKQARADLQGRTTPISQAELQEIPRQIFDQAASE